MAGEMPKLAVASQPPRIKAGLVAVSAPICLDVSGQSIYLFDEDIIIFSLLSVAIDV